jgi:hydrogenase/urease accessory protein HupE
LTGAIPAGVKAFTFGYDLAAGTFALIVHVGESTAQTLWLEGGAETTPLSLLAPPPPLTGTEVALRYFALGFTHILPKGLDHILFVVGLFLLSTKWRSVLLQVSTFTLAHSITLGLTIYGVVSLPARVVEPMIALSIAYVAIENVVTTELRSWRVALVFSFGLLHGMGFAGVLRDLGLPRRDFLAALVTFNLGVEAGQLTVVAIAFLLVAYWRRNAISYRRLIAQPASMAIALMGLYWTIQRLL